MKKFAALALILVFVMLVPFGSYTENEDAVLLARVIYAAAKAEPYSAKLAMGTLVMNRVGDIFFPDSIEDVVYAQHAFPIGERYDEDSLRAAHEILDGERSFGADVLWYRLPTAAGWGAKGYALSVGGIDFYTENGCDR